MRAISQIHNSYLSYITHPGVYTGEYYKYCVNLVLQALSNIDRPLNVVFGGDRIDFNNNNQTFYLDIQPEHTLVKLGGRSVDEIVWGTVPFIDGDGKYLIRIPNYKYYSGLDCTIEYSLPNIANIATNRSMFDDYLNKAVYIAPVIYDFVDFEPRDRTNIISMFSTNPSERRESFFNGAVDKDIDIHNIQGVFDKEQLKQVYQDTRIMVNVHQTDHHHTFEELRVLPALCNGVIIVSEDVPLKDKIPYADSIIWSSYEDLADTMADVQNNYKHYYDNIFTPQLAEQIQSLQKNNVKNLINTFQE